uniref:hypothetical protein n=1 Tax=Trebonia sp. TaxID=2767075 RepID=UPI0026126E88
MNADSSHPVPQSLGHLLRFDLAVLQVKPLSLFQISCRLSCGSLLSSDLLALRAFLRLAKGPEFSLPEVLLPQPFPLD